MAGALGLDFGTTNTVLALADGAAWQPSVAGGRPEAPESGANGEDSWRAALAASAGAVAANLLITHVSEAPEGPHQLRVALRRLRAALSAHGIDAGTRSAVLEGHDPWAAAVDFARRRRLGPFGPPHDDPKLKARQLGAFARAGHPHGLAQRILAAGSEEELEA